MSKKYKVYEVEEKVTASGKALKKLVLQGEGDKYPTKGVTMWADHPLFEEIAAGQTIDIEIEVQETATPNPHGGFYKNKTVKNMERAFPSAKPTANFTATPDELRNLINLKVIPKLEAIEKELIILNERLGNQDEPNNDNPF